MHAPLVSVVVPVYNAERFLREALESALGQDHPSFEVIVVDDGSTDSSGEIARSFAGVRYIRQPNQGPAAARNTGLAAARGEFFANLDADDVVPPGKLRVQAGYLVEHPEAAAVLGRQEWIDPPPWLNRDLVYGELGGIPLSSLVARKAVLEELGGYDPDPQLRPSEDTDLLIRMRARGLEIAVLPDLVLYRRYHGGNLITEDLALLRQTRSLRLKLRRERDAGEPQAGDASAEAPA